MIYVPEDFISSEDLASAGGQGAIINIVRCRDCAHYLTRACPMCYIESHPFTGEDLIGAAPAPSDFCSLGVDKNEIHNN